MKSTEAIYNNDLQIVVWRINGFVSYDEFKNAGIETHKLRKRNNCNKQLNNIKDMKVLSKEIQTWIDEKYFPEAKLTGLKHFAFVVPENTFGKISMESVNKDASKKYDMEIEYFEDESTAIKWLLAK